MTTHKYNSFSNILFSTPNFLKGAARVWDLFGVLDTYNTSSTEQEADNKAIYADWVTIGNDIRNSIYDKKE